MDTKTKPSGLGVAIFAGALAVGAVVFVPQFLHQDGGDDFVKVTLVASWDAGTATIDWTGGNVSNQGERATGLSWRRTVNARHGSTVRVQVFPDTPTPSRCQARGAGVDARPVIAPAGGSASCVRMVP